MRARFPRRFIVVALVGVVMAVVGASSVVTAQTRGVPERYNAIGQALGGPGASTGRVIIQIDRWSTPEERERLLAVFAEKGPDKLLDALADNKSVGYLRLPNTLAWDLRYAFETPLPEGGRRVFLATDRPISFQQQSRQSELVDYPFTLIEIRFNKDGVGEGKMSYYTKISISKDKRTVELENYGREPARLTEVTIEK